jgi:hypothetical protein
MRDRKSPGPAPIRAVHIVARLFFGRRLAIRPGITSAGDPLGLVGVARWRSLGHHGQGLQSADRQCPRVISLAFLEAKYDAWPAVSSTAWKLSARPPLIPSGWVGGRDNWMELSAFGREFV